MVKPFLTCVAALLLSGCDSGFDIEFLRPVGDRVLAESQVEQALKELGHEGVETKWNDDKALSITFDDDDDVDTEGLGLQLRQRLMPEIEPSLALVDFLSGAVALSMRQGASADSVDENLIVSVGLRWKEAQVGRFAQSSLSFERPGGERVEVTSLCGVKVELLVPIQRSPFQDVVTWDLRYRPVAEVVQNLDVGWINRVFYFPPGEIVLASSLSGRVEPALEDGAGGPLFEATDSDTACLEQIVERANGDIHGLLDTRAALFNVATVSSGWSKW
ncbi:hypothetical protein ACUN9Y_13675 [Halomonas sp. V046]|uniref:hypothetical protein n=1 Tax=Halomonas sp. V046 TaxID=3459611 RepID=UPI004044C1A0